MRKRILLSLAGVLIGFLFQAFTSTAYSSEYWAKTYGGDDTDTAESIQQTADGGYIVAGIRYLSGGDPDDPDDFQILKLNSDGTIAWQKSYGGTGDDVDGISSIRQTSDGGYIVAAYTSSFGEGFDDGCIIKLDSNGTIAWQKTYGSWHGDFTSSIRETSDGGYIAAGDTWSSGAGANDYWLLKLNSDGTIAWQKTYGGSDMEDTGGSIIQTTDGGYIIVSESKSFGAGNYDIWVLKLNSDGTVNWQKTYGGSNDDLPQSIQQTTDGGYIMVGETKSFGAGNKDMWILKLNTDGTVNWQKTYGGTLEDEAESVWQTSDGGYVVAGDTNSFGVGNKDLWILKLNTDGSVNWQKTYGGTLEDGGAESVRQTSDGGYIVAGYTESFGVGGVDLWVLKIDSNGNIGDSCDMIASTNVTPADTSVSAANTSVTPADTTVSDVVSSLTESNSSLLVDTQCLAETSTFSYDIDRFTVVSSSATFVDEFDDGIEPPSGPSGSSTYGVLFGSFSANAESGGILNMNSNDAGIIGDEIAIGVGLLDNTYQFIPGSGGFVEVKFSFPGGITTNSFFDMDISSQPWELNNPNEAVELSIAMDTPGVISAFFVAYVDDGLNEVDIDISEIDITGLLGTTTDLTVRLDISTADVVTASLDIDSDGSFDVVMPGSYTLTFPGGKPYKGGFGPGMDLETPTPDIKANGSDGPVNINTGLNLSVTVELDSGSKTGEDADWWVAESTPDGWYYYSLITSWTSAGSSYTGLSPTYQGALFDLGSYSVLNTSGLSEGTHTFYFAIDTNMNGSLDMGSIYYDSVEVNVTP